MVPLEAKAQHRTGLTSVVEKDQKKALSQQLLPAPVGLFYLHV